MIVTDDRTFWLDAIEIKAMPPIRSLTWGSEDGETLWIEFIQGEDDEGWHKTNVIDIRLPDAFNEVRGFEVKLRDHKARVVLIENPARFSDLVKSGEIQ